METIVVESNSMSRAHTQTGDCSDSVGFNGLNSGQNVEKNHVLGFWVDFGVY